MKTNMLTLLVVLPFVSITTSLLVTENEKNHFNEDTLKIKNEVKMVIKILDLQEDDQTTKTPGSTTKPRSTNVKDDSFKCTFIYGIHPHPAKCDKYYYCILFRAKLMTCPESKLFDAKKNQCEAANNVHCGSRVRPDDHQTTKTPGSTTKPGSTTVNDNSFKCPGLYGFHPHPAKCDKYYYCILFRANLKTCPESKLFDAITKKCEAANNVHCGSRERPDEPTTTKVTAIPTTTEPTTTPRPTGAPETDCDEDDVDCIITETGDVSNWFTCPRDIGSFVHPSSKKLFIFCLNWKPSVKRCGQDLIFSPELSTCVQP